MLFDAKGVAVEKDYAFVLSRSSVDSKYATLNVVLMDGTVTTLKITRNDYNSIFNTSDDFSIPYAYTTDGNGVSDLTKPNFSSDDNQASNLEIVRGYARQLRTGTVALYTDKTMTNLVTGTYGDGTFTYENNIWNVEDVDNSYEKAPVGSFSENVGREVVMVIDSDKNIVRAAYILSTLDGVYAANANITVQPAANSNITENQALTLSVTATAPGTLSYEWFKSADNSTNTPNDDTSLVNGGWLHRRQDQHSECCRQHPVCRFPLLLCEGDQHRDRQNRERRGQQSCHCDRGYLHRQDHQLQHCGCHQICCLWPATARLL